MIGSFYIVCPKTLRSWANGAISLDQCEIMGARRELIKRTGFENIVITLVDHASEDAGKKTVWELCVRRRCMKEDDHVIKKLKASRTLRIFAPLQGSSLQICLPDLQEFSFDAYDVKAQVIGFSVSRQAIVKSLKEKEAAE